jgi:iron complex outermembrane receptor protein
MRLMRTAAFLTAISALGSALHAADRPERLIRLDIESQPIGEALLEFSRQSGIQIVLDANDAGGIEAPRVDGLYTPQGALTRLLAGSDLSYDYLNDRTVAVRMARVKGEERAADTGTHVEEIIVTATKRPESVLEVPMSIAVIGNQDIERRGLVGMEDYLRSIPGVNQIDQGTRDNAIIIRGIATSPSSENFFSGATVASYFDETPITAAGGMGAAGIDVRPVDIERIEVLRGPQGTAFGSSSLGGTLRIIPAKPRLDAFGLRLAASYSDTSGTGSENSMIQGVLNAPVVENRLALRAVGYRYEESGFYRNIAGVDAATIARADTFGIGNAVRGFVQDDVGRAVSTGGRLSALWKPTEQLDLSLNYLTQTIEQEGSPVARVGAYEQIGIPVAPQGRLRGGEGDASDTQIDLVNAVLHYGLGWATLTSSASWIDSGSALAADASWSFPFLASRINSSDYGSFTCRAVPVPRRRVLRKCGR